MQIRLVAVFAGVLSMLSGCGSDDDNVFRIVDVEHPTSIVSGGDKGDLTIHWSGQATFPVEAVYRPAPNGCPPSTNCSSPTETFSKSADPLVVAEALWCSGNSEELFFDYEVLLTDANGVSTEPYPAAFRCLPAE